MNQELIYVALFVLVFAAVIGVLVITLARSAKRYQSAMAEYASRCGWKLADNPTDLLWQMTGTLCGLPFEAHAKWPHRSNNRLSHSIASRVHRTRVVVDLPENRSNPQGVLLIPKGLPKIGGLPEQMLRASMGDTMANLYADLPQQELNGMLKMTFELYANEVQSVERLMTPQFQTAVLEASGLFAPAFVAWYNEELIVAVPQSDIRANQMPYLMGIVEAGTRAIVGL